MTIREYTLKLLNDCGCQLDCYKDGTSFGGYDYAYKDLKEYNGEYPFPIEDIARELVAIGNEQPDPPKEKPKKYQVICDTDNCTDSVGTTDDFDEAVYSMKETYINWIFDQQIDWKFYENHIPHPTEKQIEDWDYMIETCTCWIAEWNEELQEYYSEKMDYYFLSDDDANKINWLTWDKLKAKYNW